MYNRARTSRQPMARAAYEASWMRRPDVPRGAAGDEEPTNPSARWLQPPSERAPRKPDGAIRGGNLGTKGVQSPADRSEEEQHIPYRWKAPRTGKSHAASRQDGGSGLGDRRRIGEPHAHREKSAHRYPAGVATGVSEVRPKERVVGNKTPPRSPQARRSDAERRETLSSPVSMGGIPSGHARRRVGDDEPGRDGVRVLVVELWEAETRSDVSRSRSTGSRKTTRASGT